MGNFLSKAGVITPLLLISNICFAEKIPASRQSVVEIKSAVSDSNNLILATGSFDPKYDNLDFSASGITNIPLNKYGIVQFINKKADFNWLNDNGFSVVQFFPNNAYVVNWQNADKNLLTQNQSIRWYGAYQSGFKVSPNLWSANRSNSLYMDLSVHSFRDTDNDILKGLIKKYLPQATILKTNIPEGYHQIIIQVPASEVTQALDTLSTLEDIQWITTYNAERFLNTEAVTAIQANQTTGLTNNNYVPNITPIWDQGLYGSGQIVGIADSGLDRNEDWFVHLDKGSGVVSAITNAEDVFPPIVGTTHPDNKVFAYWTMPGAEAYDQPFSYHGTHVTGSVAGDRLLSIGSGPAGSVSSPSSHGYDNDDGMAPNAQILFSDLGAYDPDTGVVLSGQGSIPMWQQAYASGSFIHTNSYGAPSRGEYTGSDSRADEALRQLDDLIILFAAGNAGTFGNNTIDSPGNSKNVLTVGALGHGNSSTIASFSSKGPTDDGRLKPDISATGSSIDSAAGDGNNSNLIEPPARATLSGTSMATPITAGGTALLRQYFTDGFYPTGAKNSDDAHKPSGTLMKALLLNGTNTDAGFFSNSAGWGRIWLENTLYFDGDNKRFRYWEQSNDIGLSTGDQFSVDVAVQAGEEFRATLVWYDLPGPTGSGVTLVNNLDLSVTVNGGTTYQANNFNPVNDDSTTLNASADTINSVEQVRFSAPVTGTYTVTIDATNVPGDGTYGSDKQGFALVVSGDLSSGSSVPANPTAPSGLIITSNTPSGIALSWSDVSADYDSYEIYRVEGTCETADLTALRYVGSSNTNSFTDDSTQGGYQYAYKVRAFSDDLVSSYTNCVSGISTQICLIPPTFENTSVIVTSNTGSNCQIRLQWDAATSNCPATSDVKYNIYRDTTHNFTPSMANLVTTTNVGATNFIDYVDIVPNQPYFYIVKAEDDTADGTGLNNGNETLENFEVVSSALGDTTAEGSITDDVDNLSVMQLESIWSISNEQSSNGILSYRSATEGNNTYPPNSCGRMYSMEFAIPASPSSPASLSYNARYAIENEWDGVVVEISTDGGNTWADLPPDGGYPSGFAQTGSPPRNVCGYLESQGAFTGASLLGNFVAVTHDLSAYNGETVLVRWSLSTDPGSEDEGFYLDELHYNNVMVPQTCNTLGDLIYRNSFELVTN